ncbi:MAG: flavodoxin-dependent (E)-4-hydroxy-3-methylbut-2-enyl-diphosphate synthase [Methylocystaceae bacterium]
MKRISSVIKLGQLNIGGGNPVYVQSMTNTDTRDIPNTVRQINHLAENGCEIIRVAVPDEEAALAIKLIKNQITIPLVADIHFNHRLALLSLQSGCDGLRLNPGNIGSAPKVREVVAAARDLGVPIRIGVNSGSVSRELLTKYGGPTPEAMVESALEHIAILEKIHFGQIKISLKSSSVISTIAAYNLIAEKVSYPLHLGVTEAGTIKPGLIKSALGIGHLLLQGIGDTIRVSLTANPVEEVKAAWQMLSACELRRRGVEIISCPTCGRTEINLIALAQEAENRLSHLKTPLKVAIMGCVVNGPGEAREADVGVAGGRGVGILFRHGEVVRKVNENELLDELVKEAEALDAEIIHNTGGPQYAGK